MEKGEPTDIITREEISAFIKKLETMSLKDRPFNICGFMSYFDDDELSGEEVRDRIIRMMKAEFLKENE